MYTYCLRFHSDCKLITESFCLNDEGKYCTGKRILYRALAWPPKMFFRISFRNCKRCVYNCDDLPSYKSTVRCAHNFDDLISTFWLKDIALPSLRLSPDCAWAVLGISQWDERMLNVLVDPTTRSRRDTWAHAARLPRTESFPNIFPQKTHSIPMTMGRDKRLTWP